MKRMANARMREEAIWNLIFSYKLVLGRSVDPPVWSMYVIRMGTVSWVATALYDPPGVP
jgi:hypothetical protein